MSINSLFRRVGPKGSSRNHNDDDDDDDDDDDGDGDGDDDDDDDDDDNHNGSSRWGGPKGLSRSGNRYVDEKYPMGSSIDDPNDDDCYVDKYLVRTLERKRNSVMQLMNKAEEKQFLEPDIKKWLVDIKHTIYDANALLDRIDTEARFREKYKEDGSPSYSISGFVQWATSEINRIIEELENMVKEAAAMGLKARDEGAAASAQQTRIPNDRDTSSVLGTIVYGREEEKAQILERVLYSPEIAIVRVIRAFLKKVLYSPEPAAPGNKPEVIAIVGMGGLGKTTLAQYVYNHADVERCFTRSWACVSDNFDLVRVTRDILESLTESPPGACGLASLQQQLVKQLTGKRFLVVLDDAWDSKKQNWEKLMAPFSTGAAGSKIILTTRDTHVAGAAPADHSFQLKSMSEDEAWSLFSCEVFPDGELSQHPKLEAIGKQIVQKCGGSPLAIKTLSGLLRSERKEVEWERVRESSLWQLREGQKDIIPALGLSYSYLPSHLKTCFAYCSLFPKDYRFSKNQLVNLWIDEGFLQQPTDNRSIEDVGVASFDDLSSRSFFTRYYWQEVYVMHDLIHDLAQMVFADFHLQLNGHKAVKECKKVRHVSFHDTSECGSSSILEDLNQAESLQTFMVQYEPSAQRWGLDNRTLEDVLLQQLSLRVLCLRGASIRTLPEKISNLKQLRHLDVSYTDVEELPDFLCKLYNLGVLCLRGTRIRTLPETISNLKQLRHLDVSYTDVEELPDGEFPFNSSLRKLEVDYCKNLKTINGAWLRRQFLEELEINDCPLLDSLGYSSDVDDCSSDDEFPFNSSLRVLRVWYCVNLKTINGAWLRSFTSLQTLIILGCVKLEALPEEGLPRSLTGLYLEGFKTIRRQDWIAIQNLTSLEELLIWYCGELKTIPVKLPCSLKRLDLFKNHRDLKERCKRDTGPDWHNIAHVPCIHIV